MTAREEKPPRVVTCRGRAINPTPPNRLSTLLPDALTSCILAPLVVSCFFVYLFAPSPTPLFFHSHLLRPCRRLFFFQHVSIPETAFASSSRSSRLTACLLALQDTVTWLQSCPFLTVSSPRHIRFEKNPAGCLTRFCSFHGPLATLRIVHHWAPFLFYIPTFLLRSASLLGLNLDQVAHCIDVRCVDPALDENRFPFSSAAATTDLVLRRTLPDSVGCKRGWANAEPTIYDNPGWSRTFSYLSLYCCRIADSISR